MKKHILNLSIVAAISSLSFNALAGGYMLGELGDLSTSTAGAGSAAIAEDATTAFANPAGMTRLKGANLTVNLGLLNLDSTYYDMGSTIASGHAGSNYPSESSLTKTLPIGSAYFSDHINDKLAYGVSLASTGGSGFDYENGFAGSFMAETGMLLVVQLNPSIAYQVSDKLSLGGGVSIESATLNQTFGSAALDSGHDYIKAEASVSDVAFGWNVGAMYEIDNKNRIGFTYRSQINHEMTGDMDLSVDASAIVSGLHTLTEDAQVNIIMPAQAKISGYHAVTNTTSLLWTLGWQDLSAVDKTDVIAGGENKPIVRDWKDTYSVALGGHFKVSRDLRFEVGYSYETSPQDAPDKQYVDVPTGAISKYSTGLTYFMTKDVTASVYYEYLDGGTVRINNGDNLLNGGATQLNGVYDMNVQFFGAKFNYAF